MNVAEDVVMLQYCLILEQLVAELTLHLHRNPTNKIGSRQFCGRKHIRTSDRIHKADASNLPVQWDGWGSILWTQRVCHGQRETINAVQLNTVTDSCLGFFSNTEKA